MAPDAEDLALQMRLAEWRGYRIACLPDGTVTVTRLGVPVAVPHMVEALLERARMADVGDVFAAWHRRLNQAVIVDISTRSRE